MTQHSVTSETKKGGENEYHITEQPFASNGSDNNHVVAQVVTTDEEAIAVPVAESFAVPTEPKPARPPANGTVMDSGFDCLLCGDVRVKRIRPGSNVFLSLCGDVFMDMREEDYPAGSTFNIFILRLCGNVRMIVPRGTQVRARRLLRE